MAPSLRIDCYRINYVQLSERLKNLLIPRPAQRHAAPPVAPGLYHFQHALDDGFIRFHLRVERDGHALLIAGASEAARLSPAGARIAKVLLGGVPADDLREKTPDLDNTTIDEVARLLEQLGRPSGRFPIFNLSDPATSDRDLELMAPFQADIVPGTGDTLNDLLPRLWQAGIPHVRFVPRSDFDPTLIVTAVTRAEDIGMIAGVRAAAAKLAQGGLLIELAEAGLDYVVVPWTVTESLHTAVCGPQDFTQIATAVREIRQYEMCPVIEIPLVEETTEAIEENLEALIDLKIDNVEVFAIAHQLEEPRTADGLLTPIPADQLRQWAAWTEDLAAERPWQIIWLPPVEWRPGNSVVDLARSGPRAGGDVSIRVQASGDVIPPRGHMQPAGNLLNQSWKEIWQHQRFTRYRHRVETGTHCAQCPKLSICAADCPSDPSSWALM